ncbi:hypothetical protein INR49_023482 [Caranx melampygus]|nr:hypothetical protein INR49_023482 [Caranx melampygus]
MTADGRDNRLIRCQHRHLKGSGRSNPTETQRATVWVHQLRGLTQALIEEGAPPELEELKALQLAPGPEALLHLFLGAIEHNDILMFKRVENYIVNSPMQCSDWTRDLHFITRPLTREEEDYPLAFIIVVHKELELFVRLLRAIYMPQNVYCIHVDAKAPLEYQRAVQKLVSCFKTPSSPAIVRK